MTDTSAGPAGPLLTSASARPSHGLWRLPMKRIGSYVVVADCLHSGSTTAKTVDHDRI
jgi:hypothetical protein